MPQDYSIIGLLTLACSILFAALCVVYSRSRSHNFRLRGSLELEKARREKAEYSEQIKSQYLAHLAHEIRGPLGIITGFTDLIADPSSSPEQRLQFIEILKRNGTQLSALVNDVLDFSKVEAQQVRPEIVSFSLKSLLEEVLNAFQIKAQERGINLALKLDGLTQAEVESDPTRLKQIVWNLVSNAIKFTQAGEVAIEAVRKDGQVLIDVHDTGIGLAPEHHAKIFVPFAQADESINRKFGGTGLGLALSKGLAEALGGTIFLKSSQVGQGSTFRLQLPDRAS